MIYGIKLDRIKKMMKDKEYKKFASWMQKFSSWMRGRNVAIDDQGDTLVYCDDLIRYLKGFKVVD